MAQPKGRKRDRRGRESCYPRVARIAYAIFLFLYTTNQLERLAKEVKRRTEVVEVFCGEEAVEKPLYLVLAEMNEALLRGRLRGFVEIHMGSYNAAQTQ